MPWHTHLKATSLHAHLQADSEPTDEDGHRAREGGGRGCGAPRQDPVACAEVSRRLMELARRVAGSECTVLITGESGTGKEVLARYIHRHSARAAATFVAVNCAAIPDNMLEALLFGWERGAFTGAHAAHAGKFEQAQGGTLLLDEVTEIPLALQAKLLRVLQEREVERLGARAATTLDVRVIATSNRRLREEVSAGRFREDLYYRLNVFPLAPVPLRQRREDVVPLAMRLLASHSRPGHRIPALHADAAQRLLTYPWPGNVRELDNVMQRALVLCDGELIQQPHIVFEPPCAEAGGSNSEVAHGGATAPAGGACRSAASANVLTMASPAALVGPSGTNGALAESLALAEQRLIQQVLRAHPSRERAAAQLGISARTLRYKLARLRAAGIALDEEDG
ncbi:MAG TPA: sigma-54 dependent transcriptional regulator [Steroidobacteraceae bacterium]|nr:sigma-54 dependent transcriptional regulator [Steroidobacteraceae bacterium]